MPRLASKSRLRLGARGAGLVGAKGSSSMCAQQSASALPILLPDPPAACTCRWVHADPLTNWVDRARDAEAVRPRDRQPLAYVAALAGGGAKDVTQRCVGC